MRPTPRRRCVGGAGHAASRRVLFGCLPLHRLHIPDPCNLATSLIALASRTRQELAHVFGGEVAPGLKREYGKADVSRVEGCRSPLFEGLPEEFVMWMSHGDKLHQVPEGFRAVGE